MTRSTFRKTLIALPAAAALLATALSGCSVTTGSEDSAKSGSASTKKVKTIVFDYPYTALPVYTAVSNAAKKEAKAKGVKVEFTNDNMNLSNQISNLTTYSTNKKVDAVVSFAMDPNAVAPVAKQYQDNGKLFIGYGPEVKGQDASLQFSFEESGQMLAKNAGQWIDKTLGGKGKILVLSDDSNQIGQERTKGIEEGLKKYAKNSTVVAKQQAITPDQGLSVTNTVLSKHPDVNVVLASVGDASQGGYQALLASGRASNDPKTYVGGLDGNLSLLEAMKSGKMIRGLVSVKSDEIGKAVIDVPIALGKGDTSVKETNVPVHLITQDSKDIDSWISAFKSVSGK